MPRLPRSCLPLPRNWLPKPISCSIRSAFSDSNRRAEEVEAVRPGKLSKKPCREQLILKKNPYYYAAHQIKIPEVHYYILQESSLALAMYEKNELDLMGGEVHLPLPPLEIPRIKSDTILRRERKIIPKLCTERGRWVTRKE